MATPAQMRIRLKYADVQTFVEKFAANVSRQGIFIPSKTPKPVDTLVRFELLLSDGTTRLLKGEGTVTWIRDFDPENPTRAHGMGVRFTKLDSESRRLIDRMEAWKRERGTAREGASPSERLPVAEASAAVEDERIADRRPADPPLPSDDVSADPAVRAAAPFAMT